jgi:hypothetical protein
MKGIGKSLFDRQYRVVAVENDRLLIRGILSGEVLMIVNAEPQTRLLPERLSARKVNRSDRPVNCAAELRLSIPACLPA